MSVETTFIAPMVMKKNSGHARCPGVNRSVRAMWFLPIRRGSDWTQEKSWDPGPVPFLLIHRYRSEALKNNRAVVMEP